MNKIENLSAFLAALEMLAMLEQPVKREPVVIDGCVLVELTDGNMVYDEGVRQHNALVMPEMRDMLRRQEMSVFSMRKAGSRESVLSLSINEDGICRHVVGKHNAAPSADQLDTLQQLLETIGAELQYNPFTMY